MKSILFSFFFFLFSYTHAQNPASVPLNNPVYSFLERMETLGYVTNLLDGVKPYSRSRVAEVLQILDKKREKLTAIDQRRLDDFLLDFRFEIDHTKKNALIPENQNWYSLLASWKNFKKDFKRELARNYPEEENHVILWEKDSSNFYFDYEQLFTYNRRSDNVSRNANEQSYILRGLLDNNFSYRVKVSFQSLRGDEGYRQMDPLIKGTFSQQNNDSTTTYTDRTAGELAWHTKYMDIVFAQQEISWGHGESGKLILSNYPESYPYLQISKSWGWGKFTAMHGKLQSYLADTLKDGTPIYPDKWVAAQRLEFSPWNPLTIGMNEVFIYGNRYADWAYLIPFNFYRAVQHKLRDRDNATISLDFEYIPVSGLKLYTTIFLDEMRFEKLGTNWWGNKQAVQLGIYAVDPFGLDNLEIRTEYTAIMPWVYTHKYMVNRYESDGRSLGYWAGPNSEVYYIHVKKDFHARFFAGVKLMQYKKGHNYPDQNIGGDILVGRNATFPKNPKETRTFLEGILSTERSAELYMQYEIFNDLYLSTSYIWSNSKMEGISTSLNEFHFGFIFKY